MTTTALNTKISEVENKIPDQIMLNVLLLKLTDRTFCRKINKS